MFNLADFIKIAVIAYVGIKVINKALTATGNEQFKA